MILIILLIFHAFFHILKVIFYHDKIEMFDFIIPICVKNNLHFNQLKRCIESVRKYHSNNRIILIDDSDCEYTLQVYSYFSHDRNILLVPSIYKGSADQQTFKVFLHYAASKAIMIQDSMLLEKEVEIESVNTPQFLWYFTNHRRDWDTILEPQTAFNVENDIVSHTDLIRHHLITKYNSNPGFLAYALYALENKHLWYGCFGNLCVITRDVLLSMNSVVPFIDKFAESTSNRDRRANESIFSLVCHYLYQDNDFAKNSYDGWYSCAHTGEPTGFDDLVWCCKNERISKVSFNR